MAANARNARRWGPATRHPSAVAKRLPISSGGVMQGALSVTSDDSPGRADRARARRGSLARTPRAGARSRRAQRPSTARAHQSAANPTVAGRDFTRFAAACLALPPLTGVLDAEDLVTLLGPTLSAEGWETEHLAPSDRDLIAPPGGPSLVPTVLATRGTAVDRSARNRQAPDNTPHQPDPAS